MKLSIEDAMSRLSVSFNRSPELESYPSHDVIGQSSTKSDSTKDTVSLTPPYLQPPESSPHQTSSTRNGGKLSMILSNRYSTHVKASSVQLDSRTSAISPLQTQRSEITARTSADDEEENSKLLWNTRQKQKHDPDAVRIAIPSARAESSRHMSKTALGGFRPLNTLNESKYRSPRQASYGKKFNNAPKVYSSKALSNGYLDSGIGYVEEVEQQRAKRRKIEDQRQPSTHHALLIDKDDEQDEDELSQPSHTQSISKLGQGFINGTQSKAKESKPFQRPPSTWSQESRGTPEYRKVEKTMESSTYAKAKPKQSLSRDRPERGREQIDLTILSESFQEQSSAASSRRPSTSSYQGTAKRKGLPHPHDSRPAKLARLKYETGKLSDFFNEKAEPASSKMAKSFQDKQVPENQGLHNTRRPEKRSRDVGSPRPNWIDQDASSPDPLNTEGGMKSTSPSRIERATSPIQNNHEDQYHGLEPSNIRPTQLVQPRTSSAKKTTISSGDARFQLREFICDEIQRSCNPENGVPTMYIAWSKSNSSITVIYDGEDLSLQTALLPIGKNVQKIDWNKEDNRVRLQCPGNMLFDFEFVSEHATNQFLHIVQNARGWTARACHRSKRDWMAEATEKHVRDIEERQRRRPQSSNLIADDVRRMELNRRRRVEEEEQLHHRFSKTSKVQARTTHEELLDLDDDEKRALFARFEGVHANADVFRQCLKTLGCFPDHIETIVRMCQVMKRRKDATELAPNRRATRNNTRYEEVRETIPEPLRFSRQYRDALGPEWKTALVYPQIGKNRATIEWQDLERLDEGEMLNDNIIDFYLKYLSNNLEMTNPNLAKRVHWFNSYFYTTVCKGKGGKSINYESVEKWTRKIDVFSYDFLVVPVNESAHWYVAIVCNLPQLFKPSNEDESLRVVVTPEREVRREGSVVLSIPTSGQKEQSISPSNEAYLTPPEHAKVIADPTDDQKHVLRQVRSPNGDGENVDGEMLLDREENREKILQRQLNDIIIEEGPIMGIEGEEAPVAGVTNPKQASVRRAKRKSVGRKMNPMKPCIIILDSLNLAHSAAVRTLKDYLEKEAERKKGMEIDTRQIQGWTAKGIPGQDNFSDCGVFLLGYIKNFLRNPAHFVSIISQRDLEGTRDWMTVQASDLRAEIRNTILEIRAEQTGEKMPPQPAARAQKFPPTQPDDEVERLHTPTEEIAPTPLPAAGPPDRTATINALGTKNPRSPFPDIDEPESVEGSRLRATYDQALRSAVPIGADIEDLTTQPTASSEESVLEADSQDQERELDEARVEEIEDDEAQIRKIQSSMVAAHRDREVDEVKALDGLSTRGTPTNDIPIHHNPKGNESLPASRKFNIKKTSEGGEVIAVD